MVSFCPIHLHHQFKKQLLHNKGNKLKRHWRYAEHKNDFTGLHAQD